MTPRPTGRGRWSRGEQRGRDAHRRLVARGDAQPRGRHEQRSLAARALLGAFGDLDRREVEVGRAHDPAALRELAAGARRDQRFVRRALLVRVAAAVPRDRAVDETRVARRERVVVDAQARGDAGREALEHDVGVGDEREERGVVVAVGEIEHRAALAAAPDPRAGVVVEGATVGPLDLGDLRALGRLRSGSVGSRWRATSSSTSPRSRHARTNCSSTRGAELKDDASEVAEFVEERLEGMLDAPVEFVRAARASGVTELGAIARLAEALAAAADTEEFEQAYVAYDRANRLAGKSDGAAAELDPKLATDEAELALIDAVAGASPKIAAALEAREFDDALAAAAELRAPVDRFFDEVLVMADDAQVRANRLRLLLDVRDAVGALGDLAQIPR